MAGCDYSNPTKQDVLNDMRKAFRTLDNYLEISTFHEEIPAIYFELIKYINKEKENDS